MNLLPGCQEKEQTDERSTEHPPLRFSHGQAEFFNTKKLNLIPGYKIKKLGFNDKITSTHFLSAKSSPHPWIKSFYSIDNVIIIIFIVVIAVFFKKLNCLLLSWEEKEEDEHLNHIPHTAPSSSGENRGHNLDESEKKN